MIPNEPRRPRVVLADDHPIVLAGIEGLLRSSGLFEVIAVCSDGQEALARISELTPDLAVLDVSMPRMSGVEVLEALHAANSKVRVVILTASPADDQIARIVAAGVAGFMLKEAAAEELTACLRRVADGGVWLPDSLIQEALSRNAEQETKTAWFEACLTQRERELAILTGEGLSNKQIARRVGITEGTVKLHLHKIFQKLNVPNRASLATTMMRHRASTL